MEGKAVRERQHKLFNTWLPQHIFLDLSCRENLEDGKSRIRHRGFGNEEGGKGRGERAASETL